MEANFFFMQIFLMYVFNKDYIKDSMTASSTLEYLASNSLIVLLGTQKCRWFSKIGGELAHVVGIIGPSPLILIG